MFARIRTKIARRPMSTFSYSFDASVPQTESARPFDDDNGSNVGYNSQEFDSFAGGEGVYESHPSVHKAGGEFESEENGKGFDGDFGGLDGPILPPPSEMAEEGFALREWGRQNAIVLEKKEKREKREKELLSQIIQEADEYKVEFYKKREITCENNKTINREKEKLFVVNLGKFHAEADKHYWKAIAELIPKEVPAIEKKGKKDQEKKPGIAVIQGPKPGKPTELSRMRQILITLKYNTPHLKHSPSPPPAPTSDSKTGDEDAATTSAKSATAVTTPEAVAVA